MNKAWYFFGLLMLLLLVFVIYVASGATEAGWDDIADGLFSPPWSALPEAPMSMIIWEIRLPRALACVLVGMALAVAGAIIQGLFRNPLADPGLIGVSSGSAVGAGAAILMMPVFGVLHAWLESYLIPVMAIFGALLTTFVVYRIGRRSVSATMMTMLLAGVAINAIAAALLHFMTYLADDGKLRNVTFWMMGSFGSATWLDLSILLPVCVLLLIMALRLSQPLNALLLGESEARHLGYSVKIIQRMVVWSVALAVGVSVAFTGMIGFVGLVVPHLNRLMLGPDHRTLIPACALLGAVLMLLADWVARTIMAPAELPIGIVTAVLGGPFFIFLLMRQQRGSL